MQTVQHCVHTELLLLKGNNYQRKSSRWLREQQQQGSRVTLGPKNWSHVFRTHRCSNGIALLPVAVSAHLLVRPCVHEHIREDPKQRSAATSPPPICEWDELLSSIFTHKRQSREAAAPLGMQTSPLTSTSCLLSASKFWLSRHHHGNASPTRSNLHHRHAPLNNPSSPSHRRLHLVAATATETPINMSPGLNLCLTQFKKSRLNSLLSRPCPNSQQSALKLKCIVYGCAGGSYHSIRNARALVSFSRETAVQQSPIKHNTPSSATHCCREIQQCPTVTLKSTPFFYFESTTFSQI